MWLPSIRFPDRVTWYNKWQKMEAMVDVWLYLDIRNAHCLTSLQGFLQGLLRLDTLTFSRWRLIDLREMEDQMSLQTDVKFDWIFMNFQVASEKSNTRSLKWWDLNWFNAWVIESPVYHTVDGRNPAPSGMVKTLQIMVVQDFVHHQ